MKEEFIKLLKEIKREGMDKLIEFLEGTDFFVAPASTKYHGAYTGGLVAHSMKVYEILKTKTKDSDSVKIIALLHDVCKIDFYKIDYRNVKKDGVWEQVPYYTVEDGIPYGHGEKSVMMISEYIKLTDEEKYAIRWHMGFTEPKELYLMISQAYKKYPIALLTHEADLEATYIYDV